MSVDRVDPGPTRPRPVVVTGLAARARRREQGIALAVVILPSLGAVVAAVLLWRQQVSRIDLGLLVAMYLATMLGVGVGLHRHFAHGSFRTYPAVRAVLAVLGSMAAQGPVYFWVSVHRRHHAHSDQPGDPHSPNLGFGEAPGDRLRGLWHAHTGWMFAHEAADWPRYVPDLLRDPLLLRINRHYFSWVLLGLAIPAALGGALSGSWAGAATGLLWGGLVRIFLVHHVTWSLGSLSHAFGSAPFPTHDQSTNNAWTALPTFGESWHNNHHAFPYAAMHGLHWWQVDLNGWAIRLLALARLAWDVKLAPRPTILEARRAGARGASSPSRG